MNRKNIFAQINDERERQNIKWGGSQHDDRHTANDWISYLTRHAGRASQFAEINDDHNYRSSLIKVAALAVAAIESHDRINIDLSE